MHGCLPRGRVRVLRERLVPTALGADCLEDFVLLVQRFPFLPGTRCITFPALHIEIFSLLILY